MKAKKNKNKFEITAEELATCVTEKNKAYGNSYVESSRVMEVLYPNGIPVERYDDALVVIRVIDKLFRIANGAKTDESPWWDIAGYGLVKCALEEYFDDEGYIEE